MKVAQIPQIKSKRLKRIRQSLIDAPYELCIQKSFWMTDYFKKNADLYLKKSLIRDVVEKVHYQSYKKTLFSIAQGCELDKKKIAINNQLGKFYAKNYQKNSTSSLQLTYAKAFCHTLENMDLKVYPDELIVGNCSSKRIGAPVHTDLSGVLLLPELAELSTREDNPIQVTELQRKQLEEEIFPFWFNKSVLFHTSQAAEDPTLLNKMLSGGFFVLTQIAGISHLTPNYQKVLEVGFLGIKKEILTRIEELEADASTSEAQTQLRFLESALVSTDGAINYGKRWRQKLLDLAKVEECEVRAKELIELADLFDWIPARAELN